MTFCREITQPAPNCYQQPSLIKDGAVRYARNGLAQVPLPGPTRPQAEFIRPRPRGASTLQIRRQIRSLRSEPTALANRFSTLLRVSREMASTPSLITKIRATLACTLPRPPWTKLRTSSEKPLQPLAAAIGTRRDVFVIPITRAAGCLRHNPGRYQPNICLCLTGAGRPRTDSPKFPFAALSGSKTSAKADGASPQATSPSTLKSRLRTNFQGSKSRRVYAESNLLATRVPGSLAGTSLGT